MEKKLMYLTYTLVKSLFLGIKFALYKVIFAQILLFYVKNLPTLEFLLWQCREKEWNYFPVYNIILILTKGKKSINLIMKML